ncbi:hypothetical protein TRVL_03156 [Trypanosoma vivax]|nr:hypothetical protein TRVL_03156 [Trypanosoma vivax]
MEGCTMGIAKITVTVAYLFPLWQLLYPQTLLVHRHYVGRLVRGGGGVSANALHSPSVSKNLRRANLLLSVYRLLHVTHSMRLTSPPPPNIQPPHTLHSPIFQPSLMLSIQDMWTFGTSARPIHSFTLRDVSPLLSILHCSLEARMQALSPPSYVFCIPSTSHPYCVGNHCRCGCRNRYEDYFFPLFLRCFGSATSFTTTHFSPL